MTNNHYSISTIVDRRLEGSVKRDDHNLEKNNEEQIGIVYISICIEMKNEL